MQVPLPLFLKFMPYKNKEKQNAFQNSRMKGIRDQWIRKNGPCIKCGSDKNLQVDHKDPKKKWKHRIWSYALKKRKQELNKCQVLCQKCHQNKTNRENNYGLIHGTRNGYDYYRCRCEKCREAKKISMRQYLKRRKIS